MKSVVNKFEAYLVTEKHVSRNTHAAYLQDIGQFIDFVKTKNKTLEEVDGTFLKLYLKTLKSNGIAARTAARKISSLKVFFSWAHQNLGLHNVALELVFPKLEKKLPNYLSQQEVQELLQAAHNDTSEHAQRNLVMLYLLYVTGLRVSEMIQLKTADIEFDSGCLKVDGKGNKQRVVPLPQAMLILLQTYLNTIHKKFIQTHDKTDYIFPILYSGAIKPISRQAFWSILKQLCKKTTITRDVSPHILRHSLATHLLKNGANLRSLQLLLGHENLSTVQIYTHVDVTYLRTIYDKKHPRS